MGALFLLFIIFFETAKLCLCGNSTLGLGCIESERQALLRFKASFQDLTHKLSSWQGNDCCHWKGVGCNTDTGHVVKLHLSPDSDSISPQLQARQVDSSLLELKYLNYMDLSGNDFESSSIPAFLGSMKRLRHLNLSSANFSGMVPPVPGNLTRLQVLDFSDLHNIYIDDFGWASQLSSLEYIDMSGVYLAGTLNLVQVLNTLPSLLALKLSFCGLSNMQIDIPTASMNSTFLSKLEVFEFQGNGANGSIPDTFQNMTSIRVLDLSLNQFSSIPLWFSKFKSLVYLSLSSNAIFGPIPNALRNLTSIRFLDLSANNVSSVPLWVGNFKSLVHFYILGNSLYGPIPEAFQNLTSLKEFDFGFNYLNLVPSWLGNLRSLMYIDLSGNALHGPFPDAFRNLTSPRFFALPGNDLTSSLPKWLGNLKKLTTGFQLQ